MAIKFLNTTAVENNLLYVNAANSKVGIGTDNPSSQLSIGANAITTKKPTVSIVDGVAGGSLLIRGLSPILSFDKTSTGVPKILMDTGGLQFKTGTLDAEGDIDMVILPDGNVGIGATNPGYKLDVSSGSAVGVRVLTTGFTNLDLVSPRTAGNLGGLRFKQDIDTYQTSEFLGLHGGGFDWKSGDGSASPSIKMSMLPNGNVGMGTTSPTTKLTIDGGHSGTSAARMNIYYQGSQADRNAYLDMWASEPGVTYNGSGIGSNILGTPYYGKKTSAQGMAYIRFVSGNIGLWTGTVANTVAGERLTIKSDGKVGIGTTSPIGKLYVGPTWDTSAGGNNLYIKNTNVDNDSYDPQLTNTENLGVTMVTDSATTTGPDTVGLTLYNNDETAGGFSPMLLFSKLEATPSKFKATMAGIYARSPLGTGNSNSWIDGELIFATAGAASQGIKQRMVINKEGKVGINTVSPASLLNVEGNATGDNTPQITISSGGVDNNAILQFDDDEGGQICAVGALEGNILTCASTGDFLIKTNSGSITGTTNTRLYINQSGNVGIGTGTATPVGRLQVKGGDIQTTDTTGGNGVLRIRSTLAVTPTFGYPNVGAGDAVIEGGGTTQRQPGVITLINDDSSIAANQDLGVIQFVGKDDNANGYTSSQIIGTSSGEPVTGNSGGGILRFLTSNGGTGVGVTEKMRIDKSGKVGIGVVPTATLDVSGSFKLQSGGSTYLSISSYYGSPFINTGTSGGTVQFGAPASNTTNIQVQGTITAVKAVRMGNESAAASASNAGSTRYRVSGNNSYMDMSMRTGATSYAWVNIVQNNW